MFGGDLPDLERHEILPLGDHNGCCILIADISECDREVSRVGDHQRRRRHSRHHAPPRAVARQRTQPRLDDRIAFRLLVFILDFLARHPEFLAPVEPRPEQIRDGDDGHHQCDRYQLVFAILESCISFAAEEYMQNVTDDFAREFRTGILRSDTYTQAQFRNAFCDELEVFVGAGCPGLSIDLRHFDTFAEAAALRTTVNSAGEIKLSGGFRYEPGPSQSKNVLRVFYAWPVLANVLRKQMSTLKDNKTLHFATATWQNEPFDD